ncbi:hypothetical protein NDU88_006350 [Pleurodeles waltl]|uniref:Uncharacterized protein n=1 Tax=Pleurodeles waltl TaxID=8319 RepID=A0AAV7RL68_PLEWA|nr:hypothetical protein NDU88_006350 [Pleurodeles waltl]
MRRQIATLSKQLRALNSGRAEYALLQTKQKSYAGGDRAGRLLEHRLQVQAAGQLVVELQLPYGTTNCREELIVA